MNPVFADKLATQEGYDSKGRLSGRRRDGAWLTAAHAQARRRRPCVRKPRRNAEQPAGGHGERADAAAGAAAERRRGSARAADHDCRLLGNLFGGSQARSRAGRPATENSGRLRGGNTDLAAKPKRPAPVQHRRRASTVPPAQAARCRASQAVGGGEQCSRAGAETARAANRQDRAPRAPEPEMRTAYLDAAGEQQRLVDRRAAGGPGRLVQQPWSD